MPASSAIGEIWSVFRNGKHIDPFSMASRTTEEIVPMMIGRELARAYPAKVSTRGDSVARINSADHKPQTGPLLEIKDLFWSNVLRGISLRLAAGEIVGLGGLDGQGQSELLLALFGVLRGVSGQVLVNGMQPSIAHPRQAKASTVRMALIPEDRKTKG